MKKKIQKEEGGRLWAQIKDPYFGEEEKINSRGFDERKKEYDQINQPIRNEATVLLARLAGLLWRGLHDPNHLCY